MPILDTRNYYAQHEPLSTTAPSMLLILQPTARRLRDWNEQHTPSVPVEQLINDWLDAQEQAIRSAEEPA